MNDWLVIITEERTAGTLSLKPLEAYGTDNLPIVMLAPNSEGDAAAAAKKVIEQHPTLNLDNVRIWVCPFSEVTQVFARRETTVVVH